MTIKNLFIITSTAIISISAPYYLNNNPRHDSEINTSTPANKSEVTVGLNIGNQAPEIDFPSPDGETIKLSSLKGQIVLIDFWASWCPPCRRENPNLVKSYEHFKNSAFINGKGFTVYSVSLDKDKSGWIEAIKSDKLTWTYHVSDLNGWKSEPARIYRISSIPSNILIDGNGIILAKNLRGSALDITLNKLIK